MSGGLWVGMLIQRAVPQFIVAETYLQICARLPCGEPCETQKCVTCMDDDAKATVADLIMQRAISDIDTTSDDVSEKLIALECGHIFTVETLDGHCSMSEYYDIDLLTGRYLAMKAPPVKYQTPPA